MRRSQLNIDIVRGFQLNSQWQVKLRRSQVDIDWQVKKRGLTLIYKYAVYVTGV